MTVAAAGHTTSRIVLGAVLGHPLPVVAVHRRRNAEAATRRGSVRTGPLFFPSRAARTGTFRLSWAAYGGDGREGDPTKEDVVAFLRWCQRTRPSGG